MRVFVAVIALFCFCPDAISGTGIITHSEAANRALVYFRNPGNTDFFQMIRRHESSVQAGVAFPDTFYTCNGHYESASEHIHTGQFLQEAVNNLREKIDTSQPLGDQLDCDDEKFIAFLFGVASHNAADKVFHKKYPGISLVDAVARAEKSGHYDEAHELADKGADVINLYEMDFEYIHSTSPWYVPFETLIEFLDVPEPRLKICMGISYIERVYTKLLYGTLYNMYANKTTVMSDNMDSYRHGGNQDMARATADIWTELSRVIESENDNVCAPENPHLMEICNTEMGAKAARRSQKDLTKYNAELVSLSHVKVGKAGEELKFDKVPLDIALREVEQISGYGVLAGTDTTDYNNYYSESAYAHVGEAMVAGCLDQDDNDELIVSAPGENAGEGRVYIYDGTADGVRAIDTKLSADTAAQVLAPSRKNTQDFGHSLAIVDLNGDCQNDLIVGSAGHTESLHVFYGAADGTHVSARADVVIVSESSCDWNFETLKTGDINGDGKPDLIIASPFASSDSKHQNGRVVVVFAGAMKRVKANEEAELILEDIAAVDLRGHSDYDWFGSDVVGSGGMNLGCDMFIGAPGKFIRKECNEHHPTGRVHCYNHKAKAVTLFAKGSQNGEMFGSKLALGYPHKDVSRSPKKPRRMTPTRSASELSARRMAELRRSRKQQSTAMLAVSAPHFDSITNPDSLLSMWQRHAGKVDLFHADKGTSPIATLTGDRIMSRFGSTLAFADVDGDSADDLIIAAPWHSTDPTNILLGRAKGQVYVYLGGDATFPQKQLATACAGTTPCPGLQAEGVLDSRKPKAQVGHSVAVVKSQSGRQVFVGAPRSNVYGRQAGQLLLFNNNCDARKEMPIQKPSSDQA